MPHFNHRGRANSDEGSEPGAINCEQLTNGQQELLAYFEARMIRDPTSIAYCLLRHLTLEEQDGMLRVYRMAGTD